MRATGGPRTSKITTGKNQATPHTFYEFDLDSIHPGDILLSRAPSTKSKAIQKLTKSKFSHAALCISYGHFIEAIGSGVCRLAIMQVGIRDKSNVRLLRVKEEVQGATTFAKLAAEFGHQDLLRGYSITGAIGVVVPSPRKPNEAALFCSQLVVQAYESARLPLLRGVNPNKVAPGHLVKAPHLEEVTEHAIKQVQSFCHPRVYLDDPSSPERPHQWEVKTKLKILKSKAVQKAVKALNGNARSFFELELLLLDKKDKNLDAAIHDALVRSEFDKKYYEKTIKALDRPLVYKASVQLIARASKGGMSTAEIRDAILETRQEIKQLDDDLKDRTEQHKLYEQRGNDYHLATFKYLGKLQFKLIRLNEEISTLLKGQLNALEKLLAEDGA